MQRNERRILFGDLHVHTTWSFDAFMAALPIFGGEGAHPPADACDFARHCASLDFFALTDHAESLTPAQWRLEQQSVRECAARSGTADDPDLVPFLGFEWTQAGPTAETHYGHRNVIYPGLGEEELPARPVGAQRRVQRTFESRLADLTALRDRDGTDPRPYDDFAQLMAAVGAVPPCPREADPWKITEDCMDSEPTLAGLYAQLDRWGLDALVIPHGTAWGSNTPAASDLADRLTRRDHDPVRERLVEIMSGHGNSEEYRGWSSRDLDEAGELICPAATPDFLPCCWRAGEIMRERCGDLPEAECQRRVEEARRLTLAAGLSPELVFLDAEPEDWLDCDQCRDCFKATFAQRPKQSVQYALSLVNRREQDEEGRPLRYRFGLVASSDNHRGRAGVGYKEVGRRWFTDATGWRSLAHREQARQPRRNAQKDPRRPRPVGPRARDQAERGASFLYPGGLVAVHASGRDRPAIWDALLRREVYGTSGPRILLWFDLVNGPDGSLPMGSEVTLDGTPRFEVRAVGAREQRPGCPAATSAALSAERVGALCRDECHHPGDRRHRIVAIEVVRIRPGGPAGAVAERIEDPWRRFECPVDEGGCLVSFEDPEFEASGSDTVYYVRAIQEETPAINGANLRTAFDEKGRAVASDPCYGHPGTAFQDDCLAPVKERAWSSPIFVDALRR